MAVEILKEELPTKTSEKKKSKSDQIDSLKDTCAPAMKDVPLKTSVEDSSPVTETVNSSESEVTVLPKGDINELNAELDRKGAKAVESLKDELPTKSSKKKKSKSGIYDESEIKRQIDSLKAACTLDEKVPLKASIDENSPVTESINSSESNELHMNITLSEVKKIERSISIGDASFDKNADKIKYSDESKAVFVKLAEIEISNSGNKKETGTSAVKTKKNKRKTTKNFNSKHTDDEVQLYKMGEQDKEQYTGKADITPENILESKSSVPTLSSLTESGDKELSLKSFEADSSSCDNYNFSEDSSSTSLPAVITTNNELPANVQNTANDDVYQTLSEEQRNRENDVFEKQADLNSNKNLGICSELGFLTELESTEVEDSSDVFAKNVSREADIGITSKDEISTYPRHFSNIKENVWDKSKLEIDNSNVIIVDTAANDGSVKALEDKCLIDTVDSTTAESKLHSEIFEETISDFGDKFLSDDKLSSHNVEVQQFAFSSEHDKFDTESLSSKVSKNQPSGKAPESDIDNLLNVSNVSATEVAMVCVADTVLKAQNLVANFEMTKEDVKYISDSATEKPAVTFPEIQSSDILENKFIGKSAIVLKSNICTDVISPEIGFKASEIQSTENEALDYRIASTPLHAVLETEQKAKNSTFLLKQDICFEKDISMSTQSSQSANECVSFTSINQVITSSFENTSESYDLGGIKSESSEPPYNDSTDIGVLNDQSELAINIPCDNEHVIAANDKVKKEIGNEKDLVLQTLSVDFPEISGSDLMESVTVGTVVKTNLNDPQVTASFEIVNDETTNESSNSDITGNICLKKDAFVSAVSSQLVSKSVSVTSSIQTITSSFENISGSHVLAGIKSESSELSYNNLTDTGLLQNHSKLSINVQSASETSAVANSKPQKGNRNESDSALQILSTNFPTISGNDLLENFTTDTVSSIILSDPHLTSNLETANEETINENVNSDVTDKIMETPLETSTLNKASISSEELVLAIKTKELLQGVSHTDDQLDHHFVSSDSGNRSSKLHEANSEVHKISSMPQDSVHEKNTQLQKLFQEAPNFETTASEMDSKLPVASALSNIDNFLLDLQSNYALLNASGKDISSSPVAGKEIFIDSDIYLLTWLGKEEKFSLQPQPKPILDASFTPTLPTSPFLPYVDSEKDVFIQKITEMTERMYQLIPNAKDASQNKELGACVLHTIETLYQWIEFVEVWILNISELPRDQYSDECKGIGEEISKLHHQVSNIKDLTLSVANILPVDAQKHVLRSLLTVEQQIDSTKEFAAACFTQIHQWNEEDLKLEEHHKQVNGELHSLQKKLEVIQSDKNYQIPRNKFHEMREAAFDHGSSSEMFCQDKQKLSLVWPGYHLEDSEECLNWIKTVKMMACRTYSEATLYHTYTSAYHETSEWLKRLSDIVITPSPIYIKDSDDLNKKLNYLKEILKFMIMLSEIVKSNFLLSKNYLPEEAKDDFKAVLCKAEDAISRNENKLKEWNHCYLLITELLDCLQKSQHWVEEKGQAIKVQPCPKDDLRGYVTFFESFRTEVRNYLPRIKHIKDLTKKVRTVVNCELVEDSITKFMCCFTKLQENIDVKANIVCIFADEHPHKQLEDLQMWWNEADSRKKFVCQEIENSTDVATLFENLRCIATLEAELECNEDVPARLRDMMEDENLLNIFDPNKSSLEDVLSKRNEMKESLTEITRRLIEKISSCEKKEIEKYLTLWLEDVERLYDALDVKSVQTIMSVRDFKINVYKCYKETTIISNILGSGIVIQSNISDKADIGVHENRTKNWRLNEDLINMSKFKMESVINKIDILMFQTIEYRRQSYNLTFKLESIFSSLKRIKPLIWQHNYVDVLSIKEEIQAHQNFLCDNEMFKNIKQIGEEMCETLDGEFVRKFVDSTQDKLETLISQINSLLDDSEREVNDCLNKWKCFKNALKLCSLFVSEQQWILSVYNNSFNSKEQVSDASCKTKHILENLEKQKSIYDDVILTSNKLKDTAMENVRNEIDNSLQTLTEKWQQLNDALLTNLKELELLQMMWTEFSEKYTSVYQWITETQSELLCLQTNRPCVLLRLEEIMKEMRTSKEKWKSLQDLSSKIIRNSLLDSTACENFKRKMTLIDSEIEALEKYLICSYKFLLSVSEFENLDIEKVMDIEIFLKDLQQSWKSSVDVKKEEMEYELNFIEDQLENIALKQSFLQYIKRMICFIQITDFPLASKVSEMLCQCQKMMSRFSAQYLKLIENYSTKSSVTKKINLCLKFFQKYKMVQAELQSGEFQNSYSESLNFFMKYRMNDLYIHSYRSLLKYVVKECAHELSDKSDSERDTFLLSVKLLKQSWDSLENSQEVGIFQVKKAIALWEVYLLHLHQSKMYIHKLDKDASGYPRVVHLDELNYEISKVKNLTSLIKSTENSIQSAEAAAEELSVILNPTCAHQVEESISNLKTLLENQENHLQIVFGCLQNSQIFLEEIESNLKNTEKQLKSASSFLNEKIPESYKGLDIDMNQTKIEIEKINSTCSVLINVGNQIIKTENTFSCPAVCDEVFIQNRISAVILNQLQERITTAQSSIEKRSKFKEAAVLLMNWCAQMEEKINSKYFGPPESIRDELNQVIYRDISEKQEIHASVTSLGRTLLKHEGVEENISRTLSILDRKLESVYEAFVVRLRNLSVLIKKKNDMNYGFTEMREFLRRSEEILHAPLKFDKVSEREIKRKSDSVEKILLEIEQISDKCNSLNADMNYLINDPEAFSCCLERDMHLHSFRHLFQRYQLLNAFALERNQHLKRVGSLWSNLSNLLENLEDWLLSKEQIASKTNYAETNHSRDVYLKGMKVFENLNHGIQDNVHLLHDVNSTFHTISRKDLDVDDSLKNRVMAANNRWHEFYEKVSKTLEGIKNILQMWESYDTLKEHLLLFLTETDVKLTTLEQSNYFSEDEYTSLMKEIYQHEEELLKFISLASHLKVLSQCSSSNIESDAENIQTYWDEILKRLSKCKAHMESSNALSESRDSVSESTSELNSETPREVRTFDNDELYAQRVLDVCDDEGQNEYVKDLVAALEEAEGRIESLEVVLSEPTPNGVNEESGPNYSRLLAACRSSIDVIQHLNQILSENPCHEKSNSIQFRAEDMVNRWEKIENATLDKELRAMKNAKKWQQFSLELQNVEKWLLDSLQVQASQTTSELNMGKFILLLQKHQVLIAEIEQHKKSIIALNATGQNFHPALKSKDNLVAVNEKLKAVNESWDKLYLVASEWQKKLQTEFLQSSDLANTLLEMELWLKDASEKVHTVPANYENCDTHLYDRHTEIFAIKQQLENCVQQVQILLQVSDQLFYDENSDEHLVPGSKFIEVQSKLKYILDESQDLLLACTEQLSILSKLLLNHKVLSSDEKDSSSPVENRPTRIRQCCQYLLRVARASIPIQAILFLLLGAAILIPKDEEELSCRFSNNFASSLNTMLRYPDGPPPV